MMLSSQLSLMRMNTLIKSEPSAAYVLTRATVRAADALGLSGSELGRIIGVSNATISRYRSGNSELRPESKTGELALLLVRVFRSLDPLVGSDSDMRKQWMKARNRALGAIPAELLRSPEGLVRTLAYLDGMRAKA